MYTIIGTGIFLGHTHADLLFIYHPCDFKSEIPKGFGVMEKNVQNVATVHIKYMLCTQPVERCNPMTSQRLARYARQALYAEIGLSSLFYVTL